jgi:F0F1-type ATP synthase delta subunit
LNNNLIGKRYAKAILEVAVAENGIEKYEKELSLIESVIKSDKMFQNFLASKLIGQAEKKNLLRKCLKDIYLTIF